MLKPPGPPFSKMEVGEPTTAGSLRNNPGTKFEGSLVSLKRDESTSQPSMDHFRLVFPSVDPE